MTTEEDFYRILRRKPTDHATRLIFADWLQEKGDPRAEGYRALGRIRRYAMKCTQHGREPGPEHTDYIFGTDLNKPGVPWHKCLLPDAWFREMLSRPTTYPRDSRRANVAGMYTAWFFLPTRQESEDAAALAFSRLTPERQATILAQTLTEEARR